MKETEKLEELRAKIIQWADEKGILKKATPEKQFLKFIEETGELAKAIINQDSAEFIDAIGDVFVTIVIHAELSKTSVNCYDEYSFNILDNSYRNNDKLISSMVRSVFEQVNINKKYEWAINKLWFIHSDNDHIMDNYKSFEDCVESAYNVISKRTGEMINGTFVKDR